MEREFLKSIVEGLIFAHPESVTTAALAQVIGGLQPPEVQSVLDELEQEYKDRSRGFMLHRVAGGYQFRTVPAAAPYIIEMRKIKPAKLSRAALEALSIIAYNQPVTRSLIEQIRGVESSATIRSLVDRELAEVVGKKDVPGRPLLYGTTKRFLEVFGLAELASLPPLPDVEALEADFELPEGLVEQEPAEGDDPT